MNDKRRKNIVKHAHDLIDRSTGEMEITLKPLTEAYDNGTMLVTEPTGYVVFVIEGVYKVKGETK